VEQPKAYFIPNALIVCFVVLVCLIAAIKSHQKVPYLAGNVSGTTTKTARAIWNEGTLSASYFYKEYDKLVAESSKHPDARYWQDYFSVGVDEKLYPKHPIFISAIGAVCYGALGEAGFWIANQLFLFLFLAGIYVLCKRSARSISVALVLAITPLATNFFIFSYSFSYEVLGAACILWAFVLAPSRPFISGLLLGISLHARVTHVVFLPFILIGASRRGVGVLKPTLVSTVGFLISSIPLFILNGVIWGDWLRGPFANLPVFQVGKAVIIPSAVSIGASGHYFSLSLFLGEWYERLFGEAEGIFVRYPLLFLSLLGFLFIRKLSVTRETLAAVLGGVAYITLMLCFSHWITSGGARFILPAVGLLCVTCAVIIDRVIPMNEKTQ